jgi:hypothetical protein
VARIWEVASGRLVHALKGNRTAVSGATFSADGAADFGWESLAVSTSATGSCGNRCGSLTTPATQTNHNHYEHDDEANNDRSHSGEPPRKGSVRRKAQDMHAPRTA